MLESKDPAFMLFGMKISVPTENESIINSCDDKKSKRVELEADKKTVVQEIGTLQQNESPLSKDHEAKHLEPLVKTNFDPKTSSSDEECPKSKDSKAEEKQDEETTTQDKPLKKPDKILPCPRCNSMDTKFCYYNNYNVNQPRHFCKACQRYWTAGGTMRNVPVGAGRRKSKHSSSHFGHISITEALHAARYDLSNGTGHPALKNNGRVLSFGLDAPLCESMAAVLNLADKKVVNGSLNNFHKHNVQKVQIPRKGGEIGDECSSGSSSSSEEGAKNPMQNINGFHAQMPCLHGVPWPYPWNTAISPPAFCPSGYPMSFYPPAYWNGSIPSPLSVPCLSPNSLSNNKSPSSGPNSPLGKHSREGDILKPDGLQEEYKYQQKTPNERIVVPKTLRIDDPDEAAKSSIWATLGLKNESVNSGGMFKGFPSKIDGKKNVSEPSPVLQANPAAFSRSLKLQETA